MGVQTCSLYSTPLLLSVSQVQCMTIHVHTLQKSICTTCAVKFVVLNGECSSVYTVCVSIFSFMHPNPEDPAEVPNGFLSDINPVSILERP